MGRLTQVYGVILFPQGWGWGSRLGLKTDYPRGMGFLSLAATE